MISIKKEDENHKRRSESKQQHDSECCHLFSNKLSDQSYVLSISGIPRNDSNIIIGRSDNIAQIYNVSNNGMVLSENLETDSNIIGVKACTENENIFYVGTTNCEIKMWDTRQNATANTFKDTTTEEGQPSKTLNTFDVSSNNFLISGGTDLFACDAYILFWDVRKCNLMGAYWKCHTDDITEVVFNPYDMNQLISGSTDGLINIYDLSQTCEDDALIDTLNTSSSVAKLVWYNDSKTSDAICCVTHTEDLQFWKLDQVAPYATFNRDNLIKYMKVKMEVENDDEEENVYIADVYTDPKHGDLNILCGYSHQNAKPGYLRGFNLINKELKTVYDLKRNKQVVRCSWYNHCANILLTGGESGVLDLWNVDNNTCNSINS